MTNINCLEGIRCPQCGHEKAFRIEAKITVYVTDDGTEDEGGYYDWNGESYCECVAANAPALPKDIGKGVKSINGLQPFVRASKYSVPRARAA